MKEAVIEAVLGEGDVGEVLTTAQENAQSLMP